MRKGRRKEEEEIRGTITTSLKERKGRKGKRNGGHARGVLKHMGNLEADPRRRKKRTVPPHPHPAPLLPTSQRQAVAAVAAVAVVVVVVVVVAVVG